MKRDKLLKHANDKFDSKEYKTALFNYSLILEKNPNDKEARTGAILTEMIMNKEEGAHVLHDYYTILLSNDKKQAGEIMEKIITSIDNAKDELSKLLNEMPLEESGISYADFKKLVEEKNDFKKTFENIIFSTQVIISDRDDFVNFLELLTKHGYNEMASSYLEKALQSFPHDERIRQIYRKFNENRIIK